MGIMYDKIKNMIKSINSLMKTKKLSRQTLNGHRDNISFYKKNYLKTFDVIKNIVKTLKQNEIEINNDRKEIKQYLLTFSKEIVDNLNIEVNDKLLITNDTTEFKDINLEEIEKEFIKEMDLLTSDFDKIELNNGNKKNSNESNEEESTDDNELKFKKIRMK